VSEPRICSPSGPSNIPAPDPVMPCCDASAYSDGQECTCWVGVLDVEPSRDLQEGPHVTRRRMCSDCAYRPGSPEREDAGGDLPYYSREQRFYCHTGMPRAVAYRHPELPMDVPAPVDDDYRPLMRGDRVWKADGSPGELCAGWAAATGARRLGP
jgi:hypothetical protein